MHDITTLTGRCSKYCVSMHCIGVSCACHGNLSLEDLHKPFQLLRQVSSCFVSISLWAAVFLVWHNETQ